MTPAAQEMLDLSAARDACPAYEQSLYRLPFIDGFLAGAAYAREQMRAEMQRLVDGFDNV